MKGWRVAQSSRRQSSTGSKVDTQINTLSGKEGGVVVAYFKCSINFKLLRQMTGDSVIYCLKLITRVREGQCMYSLRALKKHIYANVRPQNTVVLE